MKKRILQSLNKKKTGKSRRIIKRRRMIMMKTMLMLIKMGTVETLMKKTMTPLHVKILLIRRTATIAVKIIL